jgi:hypothetical protein
MFTYTGKETYVTNALKKADINIAYRTTNTLDHLLTRQNYNSDSFSKSGVYKLTCPDCRKSYVGQTVRQFQLRYKEHHRSLQDKTDTSRFAKHLNESGHSFGPIHNIMEVLQFQKKGTHINTVERFYIHKEAATSNHFNDPQTIVPNAIFETLTKGQKSL